MKNKFELYEQAGVLELWIVQPADKTIFQYILTDGQFINHYPTTFEDTIFHLALKAFVYHLARVSDTEFHLSLYTTRQMFCRVFFDR